MKRVVKFGLWSGVVLAGMTAVMMPLCMSGVLNFDHAEVVGYSSMVLSFLFVFFGIRSYREEVGGGAITFGKAFQVGIVITLISCSIYVITWQIVYYGFIPDFMERYTTFVLDKMQAAGESPEKIAATAAEMADFAKLYKNPLFNMGVTFLEVFPVGLVVTLVSAAILRRRRPPEAEPAMATG